MKISSLLVVLFISYLSNAQERNIKGVITSGKKPLSGVSIVAKGSKAGIISSKDGTYQIKASPKDILVYSYLGMKSVEVIVEDVTIELNIKMIPNTQQLDEVVVKDRNRKTYNEKLLEYETNTNLIKTSYGFLDKRKSGASLNIIDEADFLPGAFTFVDAIQGKFNGRVAHLGNRFDSVVIYLRERPNLLDGPQPAIYDINGIITEDGAAALAIPVSDIKRIAIIRSLSATAKYGRRATGGVIIINTKSGQLKPKTNAIEVKDLRAAQAEFIKENFCDPALEKPQPIQLEKLLAAKSEADALRIFDKEKFFLKNQPYLLLDAGGYFNTRWKNKEQAKLIWDEVKKENDNNPNVLKAIAYHFEQNGYLKDALAIYRMIAALRPEYAQTYRDLANMHYKLNNPEQALSLYTQYLKKNRSKQTDVEGISFIMNVEALNILSQNEMKILKEFKDFQFPFEDSSTRVVLEWNNGETEFDVEMVHEDKSYAIWNHSYAANSSEIILEKELGFSTEQFFINKDDTGKWSFNIKYLGNKTMSPSYLKATIQYNYGTANQKDIVEVLRLSGHNNCFQLSSI